MNRRTPNRWIAPGAGVLLAAAAGPAHGQGRWNIEFVFAPGQSGITPATPSCTVRAWAGFVPNARDFAIAGVNFDVVAADGEWSQNRIIPPMTIGASPGAIVGSSVTGIVAGQLHFPQVNIFADLSNPIKVWEATWTTRDFTPRSVVFGTRTHRFDSYAHCPQPICKDNGRLLRGLVEGAAELPIAAGCYADCDTGTGVWVLDIFDYLCFLNAYENNDPYACGCDGKPPECDIFDFLCFQERFAHGCR